MTKHMWALTSSFRFRDVYISLSQKTSGDICIMLHEALQIMYIRSYFAVSDFWTRSLR